MIVGVVEELRIGEFLGTRVGEERRNHDDEHGADGQRSPEPPPFLASVSCCLVRGRLVGGRLVGRLGGVHATMLGGAPDRFATGDP